MPDLLQRLSSLEHQYVTKHQVILERHYQLAFLKDIPDVGNLRKIDDQAAAGTSMVEEPDLHSSVFCRVRQTSKSAIKLGNEDVDLEEGNILLIRYSAISRYLRSGALELI